MPTRSHARVGTNTRPLRGQAGISAKTEHIVAILTTGITMPEPPVPLAIPVTQSPRSVRGCHRRFVSMLTTGAPARFFLPSMGRKSNCGQRDRFCGRRGAAVVPAWHCCGKSIQKFVAPRHIVPAIVPGKR